MGKNNTEIFENVLKIGQFSMVDETKVEYNMDIIIEVFDHFYFITLFMKHKIHC